MKLFSRGVNRARLKISWWAPYWFHLPRKWRELRQVGRSTSIVRICLASFVLGGAIVFGFKLAVPMISLPPLWKLLISLPAVLGFFVFLVVFESLIPAHIEVRKDQIQVVVGPVNWVVESETVRRARIVVHPAGRIRLRVFYLRQGALHSQVLGVAQKVNLDDLTNLLAVPPEVWDARVRHRDPRRSL